MYLDESYAKTMIGFRQLGWREALRKFSSKAEDRCLYPIGGMSCLWNALAKAISLQGGMIHYNTSIERLVADGGHVTGLELPEGVIKSYSYVVSTVPEESLLKNTTALIGHHPPEIIQRLNEIPFRSLLCCFIRVDHVTFISDNSDFVYGSDIKAARLTNFNAFRNESGNYILLLEYWLGEEDEIWNASEEETLCTLKQDLARFKGHQHVKIANIKILRLRNAYQVPSPALKKIKTEVAAYLDNQSGLMLAGRANQTNFNYGMNDALEDGVRISRKLFTLLGHHT
jgi:protoporphyrinogen oxidase